MLYDDISYYYVSAPAGSGKTHSAVRFAIDRARIGEKVMIAQPSKRCIAEWFEHTRTYAEGLPGTPVPVFRFDGDVCQSGQIVRSIAEHMESAEPGGEVMFLTHASLMRIAEHHQAGHWHLIVDEIPAPDAFSKHLPNNHWFLTEAIRNRPQAPPLVGFDGVF
jgi:superfamily II DNA or RNA helicase